MKRRVVLIALVLLCTQVAFAQTTTNNGVGGIDTDYGDIYVAQTSYDPYPASPGTYIDVWYKIENRGDAALDDVKFILRPESPFSLDSDTAIKSLGMIGPRSSALVKYKVRVSEDALQGDHDLVYTWTSALWTDNAERASTISVRSTDALLVVSSVTADPETVAPGSSTKVTLTLDNVGDAFIRYVTIRFGLDMTDVPFTPVGSGTSVSVLNIAPGESRTVDMMISADPDAKSKTYRIPISINYVDSAGRNVSRLEQLGVRIGAEPQLLVYTDSNEVYDSNAPGDITLRFVNNGVSGIKFLTATLQDTKKLKVLSAPTQYIGAIDSDDYQTATFTVRMIGTEKELELPVLVNYQDPNNRKYEQGLTVIVPIHSRQELGTQGGNGWVVIVVALVVVIAGFVMYRRMHKRRTARHG